MIKEEHFMYEKIIREILIFLALAGMVIGVFCVAGCALAPQTQDAQAESESEITAENEGDTTIETSQETETEQNQTTGSVDDSQEVHQQNNDPVIGRVIAVGIIVVLILVIGFVCFLLYKYIDRSFSGFGWR
jgi:uncharacterized BrkB/YihY/UPF0761 family membrane protein